MAGNVVRFSDRSASGAGAARLKVETLEGVVFRLIKWTVTKAFGVKAYSCLIDWNGEKHALLVTQQVLVDQLDELSGTSSPDEEVLVTIHRHKGANGRSYYTFADPDVAEDVEDTAY